MKKRYVFALAIFALMAGAAFGQTLSLDTFSNPAAVTYDPYSSGDSTGPQFTFTVRLSSKPSNVRSFYLLIDGTPVASYRNLVFADNSTVNLVVGFFKDSAYATEIYSSSNKTSTNIISGSFAKRTNQLTQQFTVYPSLASGQPAPAGIYTGTFTLKLYNGAYPTTTLADSQSFTYTANVNPFVDVRLGPSTVTYSTGISDYSIDLGDVSGGKTATFGIAIRANTAFTLSMQATSGKLSSTTTTDTINYSLTIGGTLYASNLQLKNTLLINNTKGMYEFPLSGSVNVPAGQDVEAGQYSDRVTFTISAN